MYGYVKILKVRPGSSNVKEGTIIGKFEYRDMDALVDQLTHYNEHYNDIMREGITKEEYDSLQVAEVPVDKVPQWEKDLEEMF